MNLQATFGAGAPLVGMVHLDPLPGAPSFDGDREAVIERAVADAHAIESGGFDAVLVENYGDVPFYPEDVPKHVVASMTAVDGEIRRALDVPVGVNVLGNDAEAAVSVAQAIGAGFVRVNVHSGVRASDQGPRGSWDGFVDDHRRNRDGAVGTRPTARRNPTAGRERRHERVGRETPPVADGAIIGTSIKESGETTNPVDEARVAGLAEATGRRRSKAEAAGRRRSKAEAPGCR